MSDADTEVERTSVPSGTPGGGATPMTMETPRADAAGLLRYGAGIEVV